MRVGIWLALCLVPACASGGAQAAPVYPGRADGEPSMECVPDADVAPSAFTAHMQRGRELAQASFEVPDPVMPPDHTAATLSAWAAGPLLTWIQQKTHAVDLAREELDIAAEENRRQRIIGGALVGLMHEDVGRIISSVPAPDDLVNEPDILAAFRHVIDGQAEPYYRLARQAYRACALNAVSPASMQHWSSFCRQRMDGLPEDESVEAVPDDTTSVEVLHD